jgi:dTDP-4-dehydrorhamnose reductase
MILILGADGLLGRSLFRSLGPDRAYATSRRRSSELIYFESNQSLSSLLETLPLSDIDTVIVCFACSDVGFCEKNIDYSLSVNVLDTLSLLREAQDLGLFSIVFSSEYVFDGLSSDLYTESDTPNPLTIYGKQKSLLEDYVLNSTLKSTTAIFRVSKLSSLHEKHSFVSRMLHTMLTSDIYTAAVDQIFTPISIGDTVKIIQYFAIYKYPGLYNLCGNQSLSRFDLANFLVDRYSLSVCVVQVKLNAIKSNYYMPPDLSMSSSKLNSVLPFELQSYFDSLI